MRERRIYMYCFIYAKEERSGGQSKPVQRPDNPPPPPIVVIPSPSK